MYIVVVVVILEWGAEGPGAFLRGVQRNCRGLAEELQMIAGMNKAGTRRNKIARSGSCFDVSMGAEARMLR